ncbi:hypothetical protein MIMGU_mgv1a018299mg [Erythranthe guttata]|uniref:Uncharacterized protein n=1 Tax=Erythranthe guttata TaxID=4155 RepID=A0A022QAN7_ERYGU|nr:hypothetical protein MIMGU_mgv1a018299mg [Erythranthe guttata]
MDLDYMDELLLEGCWLEANGSEVSNFDSSAPFSPFQPSFPWPALEPANHNTESSASPDKNVLIQVWVPVNGGGKRVLTTNNQPFSLDLNCPCLAHTEKYR